MKTKVYDLCRYLIQNLWNNADIENQQHLYEVIDHIAEQFDLSVNTSNEVKDQMYKAMKEFRSDNVLENVYFAAITRNNGIVIVCACRSYGGTYNIVTDLARNKEFDVLFFSNPRYYDNNNLSIQIINGDYAKMIVDLIDERIKLYNNDKIL